MKGIDEKLLEEQKKISRGGSTIDPALWNAPSRTPPLVGSVFLLYLEAHDPSPNGIYRLEGYTAGGKLKLSLFHRDGSWEAGHEWSLDRDPSFRTWVTLERIPSAAKGCVCSRCNLLNEHAVPNRPDGKYVCYECRSPREGTNWPTTTGSRS